MEDTIEALEAALELPGAAAELGDVPQPADVLRRALESNLTRSRAMSKEVIERVDAIEEKTRDAMSTLTEAVSRITDRVNRTERKTDTAVNVLERAVNEIDDRIQRSGRSEDDMANLQQLFRLHL